MADALVSIALEKLTNVIGQKLSLFAGATRELQKLSSTLQSIQAVLDDAERRQGSDQSVRLWLSRLKHVAYDIEDLLEDGRISGFGDEGNEGDGNRREKARWWSPFASSPSDYAPSRRKVANDITKIKERLNQIYVERNRFIFSSSTLGGNDTSHVGSRRLTASLMDESKTFISRAKDKNTIVRKLVSGSSHEDWGRLQVVAVVGIGGLGKTTLAQEIYHDRRVWKHFNTALYWVCVSDVFDEIRLTKAILDQVLDLYELHLEGLHLDGLQKELLEALRGKRFLLVLDDVWNDDAEKWNMLQLPLNGGEPGSRILVTTRGRKVAKTMNATYIHELQRLSDDDSWELLRNRAFARRTSEEYSKLFVGREIAKKCIGVPLAITVMGSAMNSKSTMAEWQNILDSEMWSLEEAENEILPALWPSYYNLSPQLKRCFAYCSMFPKDWVLEKDTVVRLWVAQGFTQSNGNRYTEDIGADHFNDLVEWSLFQKVEKNSEGEIAYKMPDLLHALAKFIAKDEIYSVIGKSEQCLIASSNVRHSFLSFTDSTDDKFNEVSIALGRATKLRTLFLHLHQRDKFNVDILHQLRFVRALVIRASRSRMVKLSTAIVKLPNVIGDLKHLRYFDLSGLSIVELPESVSDLRNLHTLNLSGCERLEKLPRGIGGMVNLRYLDLSDNSNIVELPESVSDLHNLHSLNLNGCRKLEKLPRSIGGMVGLRYLDLSGNGNIVELPESVSDLRNLHTLNLRGCDELKKLPRGIGRMVSLEHLQIEGTERLEYLPKGLGRIIGLRSLIKFIVEGGDEGVGCAIDELQLLNSLQGSLHIQHLDRVSSREEAEKAELWKKQHLCRLAFWMSVGRHDDVETERIDSVLEGLRPHENLEELEMTRFTGSKLPSWMDRMRHLRKLVLYSGLILERMPYLPSLKEFDIWKLRNEILPDEGWEQLVALQKLSIQDCRELKCLPVGLTQLSSLEYLRVHGCHKLELLPEWLGQLKKLNTLSIEYLEALRCLPDSLGQLKALRRLNIWECFALAALPQGLRELSLLQGLTIKSCPRLWERCKRDGGVDWPNISHIPNICINGWIYEDKIMTWIN